MDRPVATFIDLTARSLLAISSEFEPYVPNSSQDPVYSLRLLGKLGEIANKSLPAPEVKANGAAKTATLSTPSVALNEAKKQSQDKKVLVEPTVSLSQPLSKGKSKESASLLEALAALRESSSSTFRRTSGVFTQIIRSKPKD